MPHTHAPKKPEGLFTQGKTASNRLRRVDNFILLYEPSLLSRTDGCFADTMFVDLGYGFDSWKQSAAETSHAKTFVASNGLFIVSAEALTQKGYKINFHRKFLSRGYLIWEL